MKGFPGFLESETEYVQITGEDVREWSDTMVMGWPRDSGWAGAYISGRILGAELDQGQWYTVKE